MCGPNIPFFCTGGAGQVYRENDQSAGGHRRRTRDCLSSWRGTTRYGIHCNSIPPYFTLPAVARTLITEAVRGEGALLVDSSGHRFMPDYDERAELAPARHRQPGNRRSNAPYATSVRVSRPSALSIQCMPGNDSLALPKAARSLVSISPTTRIPVRPGAHYMIGGVGVDTTGRTSLPGLWASGEVTQQRAAWRKPTCFK